MGAVLGPNGHRREGKEVKDGEQAEMSLPPNARWLFLSPELGGWEIEFSQTTSWRILRSTLTVDY